MSGSSQFDPIAFGKNLRYARLRWKMSVRELAGLAGVSKNTIVNLEQCKPSTARTRKKIAEILHVDVDTLGHPYLPHDANLTLYLPENGRWIVSHLMPQEQVRKFDQERIQDETERLRLGRLGWITRFECLQPTRLVESRSGSMVVMEIWRRNEIRSSHPGEEFLYVIRGDIRLFVGEKSYELHQGEGATFVSSEPHDYEPLKPLGPKDLPPLALYVKLDP